MKIQLVVVVARWRVRQMSSVTSLVETSERKKSLPSGLVTRQMHPQFHKSCAMKVADLLNEAHGSDYVKLF
jgi:hypothetical protein